MKYYLNIEITLQESLLRFALTVSIFRNDMYKSFGHLFFSKGSFFTIGIVHGEIRVDPNLDIAFRVDTYLTFLYTKIFGMNIDTTISF